MEINKEVEAEVKTEVTPQTEEAQTVEKAEELTLETEVVEEETVDSLKVKLAKVEAESENYKTGMLKYKKASKEVVVDNDEIKNIAVEASNEVMEKSNEKSAIAQFTEKYPALKDPKAWQEVVSNYNPKAGKGSIESVKQDLEAALVLAKHYGGGKIAEKEVTLNEYASVSHAGSIAPRTEDKKVEDSTIAMGKMFGNSAEKLEEVSKPGSNEIDITTK